MDNVDEEGRIRTREKLLAIEFLFCKECEKALIQVLKYEEKYGDSIKSGYGDVIEEAKRLNLKLSSLYDQREKLPPLIEKLTSEEERNIEKQKFEKVTSILSSKYFFKKPVCEKNIELQCALEFVSLVQENIDLLKNARDISTCRITNPDIPVCKIWNKKIRIILANSLVDFVSEVLEKPEEKIRRHICRKMDKYAISLINMKNNVLNVDGEADVIIKDSVYSFRKEGVSLKSKRNKILSSSKSIEDILLISI